MTHPCITFCSFSWRVFCICPAQIICNILYNSTKDFHRHTQSLEYFSLILHQIYLQLPQSFLMKHQFIQACGVESTATGAILLVEMCMWNCHIRPCGAHHCKACGTCCAEKCTLFHLSLYSAISYTVSSDYQSPALNCEVYKQSAITLSKSSWDWNCSQKKKSVLLLGLCWIMLTI